MDRSRRVLVLASLLALITIPAFAIRTDLGPEPWLQYGPYGAGTRHEDWILDDTGVWHYIPFTHYYPAVGDGEDAALDASDAPYPVLFFQHAFGAHADDYDYLFTRLASRGIHVISIDHTDEPVGEPDWWEWHRIRFRDAIDLIFEWNDDAEQWMFDSVDPEHIGLGGHSHGAAFLIMQDYRPMNPDGEYEIDSVSLLAPCPDVGIPAYLDVYGGMPPLQIVYGSKDQDGCVAYGQAIAMFEAGGSPRQFVYVEGASHTGWQEDAPLGGATITREEHHRASTAALAAWHARLLQDDETADPWVRGDRPLLDDAPVLRTQFIGPTALVVDDHEDPDGETLVNSLGLPIDSEFLALVAEIDALLPPRGIYHPTRVHEIGWNNPAAWLRHRLTPDGGPGLDVRDHDVLSLRVLIEHGSPWNPEFATRDFHVELTDVHGTAAWLALSDARQGPLRYPPPPAPGPDWKSVFETYRLELGAFAEQSPGLDLGALAALRFVFDIETTARLMVDDLAFAPGGPFGTVSVATVIAPARPFFTVYPNPIVDRVRVDLIDGFEAEDPARITLYDVGGHRVGELFRGTLRTGEGLTLDLTRVGPDGSRPASGIYLLSLEAGRERATRRLIVLR